MPVAPDAQSLTTAAEQAASSGDFPTAARYLTLAADLQAAGAGAVPGELANTLNNLGVVYERLDRPGEAERCYRRAHAVARAVLPAEHPAVVLSEKNLREFCEGRGIPFDEVPVSVEAVQAEVPSPPAVAQEDRAPAETTPQTEPSQSPRRALVVAGIAVVALAALALVGIRSFETADAPAASEPAAAVALEPRAPAPAPPPAPPPPVSATTPTAVRPEPGPAVKAAAVPTVVTAAVCGSLETRGAEWQCAPPAGGPGTFFFYTRLAAPVATTVEHRWYHEGRLYQAVSLSVPPNPQRGYRTYSRVTISDARPGSWRVELRSPGGEVLHEERFSVGP